MAQTYAIQELALMGSMADPPEPGDDQGDASEGSAPQAPPPPIDEQLLPLLAGLAGLPLEAHDLEPLSRAFAPLVEGFAEFALAEGRAREASRPSSRTTQARSGLSRSGQSRRISRDPEGKEKQEKTQETPEDQALARLSDQTNVFRPDVVESSLSLDEVQQILGPLEDGFVPGPRVIE